MSIKSNSHQAIFKLSTICIFALAVLGCEDKIAQVQSSIIIEAPTRGYYITFGDTFVTHGSVDELQESYEQFRPDRNFQTEGLVIRDTYLSTIGYEQFLEDLRITGFQYLTDDIRGLGARVDLLDPAALGDAPFGNEFSLFISTNYAVSQGSRFASIPQGTPLFKFRYEALYGGQWYPGSYTVLMPRVD